MGNIIGKKRILVLNGNMNRGGGTEKMTQILANRLCHDFDISVLSLQPCSKPYYELSASVSFLSLKRIEGRFGMFKILLQLFKAVKKMHPDVIINVDVFLAIYSIPLKLLFFRLKVISWEHFSIENDMGLSWINNLRSFALKFSNYYVCLTEGDLKAFKKRFNFTTPIQFIYNPYESQAVSGIYSLLSKKIVSAGNLFPAKGFDLAIEVAKDLLDKHPDWRWIIYGDGPEKEHLSSLISAYQLQDRVLLPGRTTDKDKMFADSSIYVLTSRTEGFGLVLLEAQSYNLPTVAFDVPYGPREIIVDNVNGKLIEPFNTKAMFSILDDLISDTEKRLSYSKHAKDKFPLFTIEVFHDRWKSILDAI